MTTMSLGKESSTAKEAYHQGIRSPRNRLSMPSGLCIAYHDRRGPGGAARQAAALEGEGVIVIASALNELSIDFATFGWFPSLLPSEENALRDTVGE